jgi:hypothetical protein
MVNFITPGSQAPFNVDGRIPTCSMVKKTPAREHISAMPYSAQSTEKLPQKQSGHPHKLYVKVAPATGKDAQNLFR